MSAMSSQITGVSIVCSNVCWGPDQRKHQSSVSLAFVGGIHQWPVEPPHKGPVTQKMFSSRRHSQFVCILSFSKSKMKYQISDLCSPVLCRREIDSVFIHYPVNIRNRKLVFTAEKTSICIVLNTNSPFSVHKYVLCRLLIVMWGVITYTCLNFVKLGHGSVITNHMNLWMGSLVNALI